MLMGTVSNDGAMVEKEDAFSVAEGAEAVGNNKGGAPGRDLSEFALDVTLALGIKGSGCLIKDENGGVFNESTSDGNAAADRRRGSNRPRLLWCRARARDC